MKRNKKPIFYQGLISLEIDPVDSAAWKFSMLHEAATSDQGTIEQIAQKYGYTREYFYIVKKSYKQGGIGALQDKPQGPKSNYIRTKEIEKQIVRHRFLDPEANSGVIAQKMKQSGHHVSQRSVERTINEYRLQKKGYIRQWRQQKVGR